MGTASRKQTLIACRSERADNPTKIENKVTETLADGFDDRAGEHHLDVVPRQFAQAGYQYDKPIWRLKGVAH